MEKNSVVIDSRLITGVIISFDEFIKLLRNLSSSELFKIYNHRMELKKFCLGDGVPDSFSICNLYSLRSFILDKLQKKYPSLKYIRSLSEDMFLPHHIRRAMSIVLKMLKRGRFDLALSWLKSKKNLARSDKYKTLYSECYSVVSSDILKNNVKVWAEG